VNNCLIQYFRCPQGYLRLAPKGAPSATTGYFQFGDNAVCYGTYYGHRADEVHTGMLHDALCDVEIKDGTTYLPFDPSQVVDNPLRERYANEWRPGNFMLALAKGYYQRHAPAKLRSSRGCLLLSLVSNLNPGHPSTPDFAPSVGASVTRDTTTPQLKAAQEPLRSEPMTSPLFHRSVGKGIHSYLWHGFHGEDGFCTTPLA
jgi:hypothetical protein